MKAILDYGNPRVRRSVGAVTWLLREIYYRRCVKDPDLRRRLTPTYGFACKRPSLSSSYLRAFNRHNVELITEPIERLTPDGIRMAGGTEHQLDAIVLATGFVHAHEPDLYELEPVRGRDGFDLAKFYAENRASSYEGVTQPGLPNHVFIYGPYGGTGATWHTVIQVSMTHAIRLIREAQRRGVTRVEVRPEAADRWTQLVRDRLTTSLFQRGGCEGANSYYFDRNGDTPVIRPASTPVAMAAQRNFPFDDYTWTTGEDL
jgi:cation diffusion facilitator CzcD-associated flavoprotein CzcO